MAASRKEYGWLVIVATVLITALLLARSHAESLSNFIDQNAVRGVFLYIILNVLDAVIAPGATLPLIPIAARVWGRVFAGLITTVGWTTGSLLAFLIARRWGQPVVKKITSMERIRRFKRYIPEDLFWSVVLLRLVMPMDVISYVLGLFTDMRWSTYIAATALGLTPSALVLAYLGRLPQAYEILTFGIAGVVAGWFIYSVRRSSRKRGARRAA